MTLSRLTVAALAISLALVACKDDQGVTTDDTNVSSTDDTGPGGGDDTEPQIPTNESDCEDGVDEDQDGVTDCEDPDCAEAFRCTWPTSMEHTTNAFFDGYEIECRLAGFPYDVQVDDCQTDILAPLEEITEGNICAACDKSFLGPVTVIRDSCSELLGDAAEPPPRELAFGFQFISPQERVLWARDADGVWAQTVTITPTEGVWTFSTSDLISDDIDECDNGMQDLGLLTVTFSFTDL